MTEQYSFEVKQGVVEIINNILDAVGNFSENDWSSERNGNQIIMRDVDFPNTFSTATLNSDGTISILMISQGFEYKLSPLRKGGCAVIYSGNMASLFSQVILPKMTYIPGSLCASPDCRMTFMPIVAYMDYRMRKGFGIPQGADRRINKIFHNEIPFVEEWLEGNAKKAVSQCPIPTGTIRA